MRGLRLFRGLLGWRHNESAEPRRDTPQLPGHIGIYRIERGLGRGGMGEVYLAWDDRLGRQVAIKQLRRDRTSREDRSRLRREARAIARLSHPAIAQVHDVVFEKDIDAIVMEYVEGRTLAQLLAAGEIHGGLAIDMAIQIAQGLTVAHNFGLVHRDLKTENVMVNAFGYAKILDFGLVKSLADASTSESITQKGILLGTMGTMSPEQTSGEEVDARSDLFSFGILLYEIFTGYSPFRRENWVRSLKAVQQDHPVSVQVLRPELPEELARLIEWLLQKDPDERPPSTQQVVDTLAHIAAVTRVGELDPPTQSGDSEIPEGATTGPFLAETRVSAPRGVPRFSVSDSWLGRNYFSVMSAIFLALTMAGLWTLNLRSERSPAYVLVLEPELADASVPDGVVAGVLSAALATLERLDAVHVIEPSEAAGIAGEPAEKALFVGAGEVLDNHIECGAEDCRVTLRRRLETDWRVAARIEEVEVSGRGEDARGLAKRLDQALRRLYPGYRGRPGIAELEAEAHDYSRFFKVRHRLATDRTLDEDALVDLDLILTSSPRFLDALILATDQARRRGDVGRALEYVRRVKRLDRHHPPGLWQAFHIELALGKIEEAEKVLGELSALLGDDVLVLRSRAELRKAQGHFAEAAREAFQLVGRQPSWRNVSFLADLEVRAGEMARARTHFERLIELAPQSREGPEKLAEFELFHGDPRRAEEIYGALLRADARPFYSTQAGRALLLLGQYEAAVGHFRRAVDALGRPPERLELAMALTAGGRHEEARPIFRALLTEIEALPEPGDSELIIQAACMSHLGIESERVAAIVDQVLKRHPGNVRMTYSAAVLLTLSGFETFAIRKVEEARELGLSAPWFGLPVFEALQAAYPERYAEIAGTGETVSTH